MFTTRTPDGAMIRNYAITLAPVALQLSQLFLEGVIRPDVFDVLRNAALASWIPSLLIVRRSIHNRF